MTFTTLLAMITFLFPLAYSPGPGNSFFASVGASHGLRGAMPSLIGYHVATFVVTVLIGLGMKLTVLADHRVATALAIAGGLYMLWLGYLFVRAALSAPVSDGEPSGPAGVASFLNGAMVLVLNPKAYAIIILLFTQFLGADDEGRLARVLGITTIFTLNNFVAFIVWTLAGVAISRLFRGHAANRRINLFFALCIVGVGIWTLVPVFST